MQQIVGPLQGQEPFSMRTFGVPVEFKFGLGHQSALNHVLLGGEATEGPDTGTAPAQHGSQVQPAGNGAPDHQVLLAWKKVFVVNC